LATSLKLALIYPEKFMTIYQIIGANNEFMSFRSLEKPMFQADGSFANEGRNIFSVDGCSKKIEWILPPKVLLQSEPTNKNKYKGKVRKIPDVGHLAIGSLVFSERAVEVLGDYLKKYWELLKIDAEGTIFYFYNVTNVIDMLDPNKSEITAKGSIINEVFNLDKSPKTSQVFKVKGLESSSIYFNTIAGHTSFIDMLNAEGLLGGTISSVEV
jgi:hypothetical protein